MYEADRTPGADRDYLSDILVSKKKHEVIWYLPRATIHLKKKNEGKIDSPYTYTGMHTCVHTHTHTHCHIQLPSRKETQDTGSVAASEIGL
jgi:hypothetical protein